MKKLLFLTITMLLYASQLIICSNLDKLKTQLEQQRITRKVGYYNRQSHSISVKYLDHRTSFNSFLAAMITHYDDGHENKSFKAESNSIITHYNNPKQTIVETDKKSGKIKVTEGSNLTPGNWLDENIFHCKSSCSNFEDEIETVLSQRK